jgi:hypothetical protein
MVRWTERIRGSATSIVSLATAIHVTTPRRPSTAGNLRPDERQLHRSRDLLRDSCESW